MTCRDMKFHMMCGFPNFIAKFGYSKCMKSFFVSSFLGLLIIQAMIVKTGGKEHYKITRVHYKRYKEAKH